LRVAKGFAKDTANLDQLFPHRKSEMAPSPHQQPCQDSDKLQDLIEQLRSLPRDSVTIPKRIQLCCQALEQVQQAEQPELFARLHFETGLCLAQMSIGDPNGSNGQEQAISHFERALEVFTPATCSLEWLDTTYNLALLYERRIRDDRADNIDRAIGLHEEIVGSCSFQISPTDRAASHTDLGRLYFQRIEGDKAENLETAIQHCQHALEVWTRDEHTISWAEVQDLLGTLFRRRLHGDPTKNLEDSLFHHQVALEALEPIHGTCAEDWARIHHNLGTTLLHRISGNRGNNLEQAIMHFKKALEVRTRGALPEEWAETQHNLAIAHIERQQKDRTQDVERALELLNAVSQVYRREAFPIKWAINQSILGNAYLRRIRGERAENIERAIRCYQQALEEKNWGAHTEEKADAEHNLAVAYSERLLRGRIENLEKAVKYGEAALKTIAQYSLIKWALIKTDMVDIHWKLANLERQRHPGQAAATMEKAIAHGEEVVSAMENQPPSHRWALAHYNLGNAYGDRIQGDRADNQEKAIAHYNCALDLYTKQNYPVRWANAHNNLGVTYWERLRGDRTENLARAIYHFRMALEVSTPEAFSVDARRTARNLGNLYFQQRDWDTALDVYYVAMDAGERLYRAGLSAEGKAVEVAETVALYRHAAFATARLRQASEALLTFERGKTRLLAEALRLHISRPASVPDKAWTAFEQAGAMVRTVQSGDSVPPGEEHDPVRAYTAREQAALKADTALDAAIKRIRRYAPGFLKDLDLSTILDLLPDKRTALVAFCITDQGSMGFVVSHNQSEAVQIVDVPCFCQADLRRLLFAELDEQGQMTGGWIGDYMGPNRTRWCFTMKRVLAEIGQKLFAPIAAALPKDVKDLILLPSGGLFILPLHAMPLSSNGSDLVCDRYQVSYAPSIEVLADCQAKAARSGGQSLYAAINPEEDPLLAFTLVEGAAIAALFDQRKIDEGGVGTKDAVKDGVRGKAYLHFSCHAVYKWHDPPQSGLILADGRLTLAELQNGVVDMSAARLVTLSACETGLTDILKGSAEEYVGLPAGFMLAGVPCVVSSLWSVPDLSTALLMERFYENHLCGDPDEDPATKRPLPPAQAMRRAQRWLRDVTARELAAHYKAEMQELKYLSFDQALNLLMRFDREKDPDSCPFAHPVFWAPFTVSGL
jgi:CHAT domain-containing protein/tetratricopeptide (TPR) repeat protein